MISPDIKPYLVKVCGILNAHDVEYLVVGGAAVSHHGFNRVSGIGSYRSEFKVDLDFWYNPTIINFEKIVSALDVLNVDITDLKKLVFDKKRTFLKIPHPDFHTDFLPVMKGLHSFRESYKKADQVKIGEVTLKVISVEDLIMNKRTVNRNIDQSDLEELIRLNKSKKRKRK
jgi:predicted nucleotidyltransferase